MKEPMLDERLLGAEVPPGKVLPWTAQRAAAHAKHSRDEVM
jgi:hypothetical protein